MKTVVDYLQANKTYEEEIAGYNVKLKLVGEDIVLQVDDDQEYLIEAFGDVSAETEIKYILEDDYGANIRFCEVCGIPYDMGFVAGDGDWYCCQSCFETTMDKDYGEDGWRVTEEEGEYGGYYEYRNADGEWIDTGIYYTEWN